MARPYTPKINKHVTYTDANGKPRPAIVTNVTNSTTIDLRVGRSQSQTAVGRDGIIAKNNNSWRPA